MTAKITKKTYRSCKGKWEITLGYIIIKEDIPTIETVSRWSWGQNRVIQKREKGNVEKVWECEEEVWLI